MIVKKIPYGRQWIDQRDVDAVVSALHSDWLTTGPKVDEFEKAFCDFTGTPHSVAMANGTAALHAMMHAVGIGPGDEVIVPALTFAASANAVVYLGGTPVFADIDPGTLTLDPKSVEGKITSKTKAILAVDYAGQPCDYDRLDQIAGDNKVFLLADACHSLGATYKGKKIGTLAALTAFSFHPVKHITTGEGGMVTGKSSELCGRVKRFRNHGLSSEARKREEVGAWHYDMEELGFNYRLSDIQCALGLSQLTKLPTWIEKRQEIAQKYRKAFEGSGFRPLTEREPGHSYHLFVIRAEGAGQGQRDEIIKALRNDGIMATVHYRPVYQLNYYKKIFKGNKISCPIAETAFEEILSIPLYPNLTMNEVDYVIEKILEKTQFLVQRPKLAVHG